VLGVYVLSLATSSGLVGVFVRQFLAEQGYVPGLRAGAYAAISAACAFAALQLAYMTTARFLWPTRAKGPLVAESLSQLAALLLLPFLLHVQVQWPHPALVKVEPLIYLGAFATVHIAVKFVSLYAVLRGEEDGRLRTAAWLAATCVCALAAYWCANLWVGELAGARPMAQDSPASYRVDGQYASARRMPEGALVAHDLSRSTGDSLTLRWANPPDAVDALEEVFVTVIFTGDGESTEVKREVTLSGRGWSSMRIAVQSIPATATSCTVTWASRKEPIWRRISGLKPVALSGREVLLSGPLEHRERGDSEKPNVVILAVEGLGSAQMSGMGYNRKTTPALDHLADSARTFTNVFSPSPESEAACMTMVTGLSPLRHGYLGKHSGPLPESAVTLAQAYANQGYATAAFFESDHGGSPGSGRDCERGFELVDVSYARDAIEGASRASKATLVRLADWVDAHADAHFAVFARLTELREPELREEYGTGFIPEDGTPSEVDIYDTALAHLDQELGDFFKHLDEQGLRESTCIVVTSPYGSDFSSSGRYALSDNKLRVPVIIAAPGLGKGRYEEVFGLENLAPTLASLTEVNLGANLDGRNMLVGRGPDEAIAMYGDPLALVIRSERWRLEWQSPYHSFGGAPSAEKGTPRLYDMRKVQRDGSYQDVSRHHPELASQMHKRLDSVVAESRAARGPEGMQ
jgi:arylsulfatase A-like enzyme